MNVKYLRTLSQLIQFLPISALRMYEGVLNRVSRKYLNEQRV